MIKPKPCPFCGSKDIYVEQGDTYEWGVAVCTDCGAVGPSVKVGDWVCKDKAQEVVLKEWNGRFTIVKEGAE